MWLTAHSPSSLPTKPMHPGRIILGKPWSRRRRVAQRTPDAFKHKSHIVDVASCRRSRPAVDLEDFENLFAIQRIRGPHVTDRLHRVCASSEHLAERQRSYIADPVGNTAEGRGFGGQRVHGSQPADKAA